MSGSQINRNLPRQQLLDNRQPINNNNNNQNIFHSTNLQHSLTTQTTQNSQTRMTGHKSDTTVPTFKSPIFQFMRNNILTAGQKNSFLNLASLLNVLLSDKFSDMFDNRSNQSFQEETLHFFNTSNNESSVLTKEDIIEFIMQSNLGILTPEEAKELTDYLIEISMPEHKEMNQMDLGKKINFESEELTHETKNMLKELGIEEEPSRLKVIADLLEQAKNSPRIASDELKKKLKEKLKETDKDEEVRGIDFNYMEISKVE